MKYVFGPVFSRRLGFSLGVDLVPFKVCSMDCLYCEVGATTEKTLNRAEYVPFDGVKSELSEFLKGNPDIDYITFSGYGEPTLFSRLGDLVKWIKDEFPQFKLALLTNSSLLHRDDVMNDVKEIDLVLPSLDAATDETFKKLNRPVSGLTVNRVVEGILRLKSETESKIWLETLFVRGINDKKEEIERLGELIYRISPDKWHLNTVVRPPAYGVEGLSFEKLSEIAKMVNYPNTEIVAKSVAKKRKMPVNELREEIYQIVVRRPCPVDEIADALGVLKEEVESIVEKLEEEGKVKTVFYGGEPYVKGISG